MTHLKADFAQGLPISQISAAWLNGVANFINNLAPGNGVKFTKHLDGNATIIETSGRMGTPTDNTGANSTDDEEPPHSSFNPAFTDWDAFGANGVKLRLYALTKWNDDGFHYFYPLDIEITNSGIVKSIKRPTTDAPITIGA